MKQRKLATSYPRFSVVVALALVAISGCSAPETPTTEALEADLACVPFTGNPADLIEVNIAVLGNAEKWTGKS